MEQEQKPGLRVRKHPDYKLVPDGRSQFTLGNLIHLYWKLSAPDEAEIETPSAVEVKVTSDFDAEGSTVSSAVGQTNPPQANALLITAVCSPTEQGTFQGKVKVSIGTQVRTSTFTFLVMP